MPQTIERKRTVRVCPLPIRICTEHPAGRSGEPRVPCALRSGTSLGGAMFRRALSQAAKEDLRHIAKVEEAPAESVSLSVSKAKANVPLGVDMTSRCRDGKTYITELKHDGPLHLAGAKVQDRIVSVNGRACTGAKAAAALLAAASGDFEVVVERVQECFI